MLVKAKWTVKDASGWHDAGAVFETDSDLGDAVEVLSAPKKPAAKPEIKKETVKAPEVKEEPKAVTEEKTEEPAAEESPRPRSSRRKTMTK